MCLHLRYALARLLCSAPHCPAKERPGLARHSVMALPSHDAWGPSFTAAAGSVSRGAGELVHGPLALPVKRKSAVAWVSALPEVLARFVENAQAMSRAVRRDGAACVEDMVERGRRGLQGRLGAQGKVVPGGDKGSI